MSKVNQLFQLNSMIAEFAPNLINMKIVNVTTFSETHFAETCRKIVEQLFLQFKPDQPLIKPHLDHELAKTQYDEIIENSRILHVEKVCGYRNDQLWE